MQNYKDLLHNLLEFGEVRENRTGIDTVAIFGVKMGWDLREGFPAVTTKTLAWKSVVSELIWFLSGSTNVESLRSILHGPGSDKKTIWDENYENQGKALGYSNGNLGPVYGGQWRNFGGVDQIAKLIKDLKENPDSRRHIVSAWNPVDLDKMALPPCHYSFQCNVNNGYLDLLWNQRSVDTFLGLPFNIASYALLAHILAKLCGLKPRNLVFFGGDVHIYDNHQDQVAQVLAREPLEPPKLVMPEFSNLKELFECNIGDFKLENYKSHGTLKAPMAV